MNNRIFVKPAEGVVVNMPERDYARLPDKGVRVARSSYWTRRIKCGDVILIDEVVVTPDPVEDTGPPKDTASGKGKRSTKSKTASGSTGSDGKDS